jgi:hypothetical protein
MTGRADRWLRLVTALAAGEGAELTVAGMCSACATVLLAAGAAIVVMINDAMPAVTYSSDARVSGLEDLQFVLGVGPGPDAYREAVPVTETDLVNEPPSRWAGFAAAAVDAGVTAVFSFPLRVGAARLGVLTLYRDRPGSLDDERYTDALFMAGIITRAVLAMQAGASDGMLAAELSDGGVDHAEVHQASGMVSVQLDVGVGEALARLRGRAFVDGVTVHSVAVDVLAGRLAFEP